jgi:Family of unknown function (DUF6763)
MNMSVGRPEIGQWYARADKGESFRVVGRDDESRTIEIQSFDGDIDEIDAETWSTLPLERSEPPEDWTAPMDDVEADDLGYTETDMAPADWARPLQPLRVEGESWEETEPEEERDALGEGTPAEPLSAEVPETNERGS